MSPEPLIVDVDESRFDEEVLARSAEVPVVVDFWAEWCGPCRTLGPLLEQAVQERSGTVALAKVDVDRNPSLAARYRVQGIPAVKAFRDGEVVEEFTGAQPPQRIAAFLDRVVPSEADRAAARGEAAAEAGDRVTAEREFRSALSLEAAHRRAAVGLARLVVEDDPEEAMELVRLHRPDPDAEEVASLAELRAGGGGDVDELSSAVDADPGDADVRLRLGRALAARGAYEGAVEHLLAAVRLRADASEPAREQLLAVFRILGDEHELVRRSRPQLARALF